VKKAARTVAHLVAYSLPLAYAENGQCRLVSRHRNKYKSFDTLSHDLSRLRAKNAVLDGEIICLDFEGRSQFKELFYRRGRAVFFAFDLVWLNDSDLRKLPLIERKKNLKRLIERSTWSEIIYAQHVEGQGKLLFEEVCERNLEGMVCKRKNSIYAEHGWVKIKNPDYTQAEGRHEMFTVFRERPRRKSTDRGK
jgi:bifunctional non-homologous end joining protein LigD